MPLLPNTNSSDLLKSLQTRTVYANYIIQQQKIAQGCITVVSRANTQASDLYQIKEGAQLTTPTFQSTLLADPANGCPPSAFPPGAPTNIVATAGAAQVTLTWSAPSFTGTSPITSYRITSVPLSSTVVTANTTATITGLTNGTSYIFSVVATNSIGNSIAGVSNSVTPTAPPLKLLVIGDSQVTTVASVISSRLTALGYTGFTVDSVVLSITYNGNTLTIANYNTALIWTNSSHTGATGLGAAIRSFVNAGGNVVSATFIWNLYASDIDFTTTPFQPRGQSNDSTAIMIIDVVHPITTGVTLSLNGGNTVLTNGAVVLQSGATRLARFTATGDTVVGINTVGTARLVGLNLYISNLSSTPIRDLTINSCLWANKNI
jgi:hypothetical protein